ncbi:hypothetical protein GCM10023340_18410 [Nocardioides marinquilinus]|uniref:Uncharacterized protein n=1 Tax=Nocardioides marinquilinus TaxID=1210400 RepID=A0ABP9PHT8_9ACTN
MSDQRTAVRSTTRRSHDLPVAAALAVLAVGLAWGAVAWALDAADGAVRVSPGSTSYRTEFIDTGIQLPASVVAVVLVVVAGWFSWRVAGLGLAGVVAALWWGASVTVRRYEDSGWSDGLEVFAFVVPILAAVFGALGLAVLVAARGRR